MSGPRLLISGAGIAGLALARCCERLGLSVVLIERQEQLRGGSTGIALPFNAMSQLRQLGLAQAVRAAAHPVQEIFYTRPDGRLLARASLTEAPLHHEPFVALRRDRLHAILQEGLATPVHLGVRIDQLNEAADGVDVVCSDPALSGRYDLLVSAEGLRSALRQRVWGDAGATVDFATPTWRFLVNLPAHGLQPQYLLGRRELFMAYPIGPDTLYCYGHVHDPEGRYDGVAAREALSELFGGYGGVVPQVLQALDARSVVPGRLVSVAQPCLVKGRVVCVGDAAHACSPLLQQGAAMAMADALCLAEQLVLQPTVRALAAYEQQRRPEVEWVTKASDGPVRLLGLMGTPVGSWLRNLVIRSKGPLNVAGWRDLARRQA